MSLESDIERLKLQEQKLRFEKFDEADAWKLGTLMRDAAIARKLPLVIDIRVAGTAAVLHSLARHHAGQCGMGAAENQCGHAAAQVLLPRGP